MTMHACKRFLNETRGAIYQVSLTKGRWLWVAQVTQRRSKSGGQFRFWLWKSGTSTWVCSSWWHVRCGPFHPLPQAGVLGACGQNLDLECKCLLSRLQFLYLLSQLDPHPVLWDSGECSASVWGLHGPGRCRAQVAPGQQTSSWFSKRRWGL